MKKNQIKKIVACLVLCCVNNAACFDLEQVPQEIARASKKVKKEIKKSVKHVQAVGEDALKELSDLNIPTSPSKLIAFALDKMPQKKLEQLSKKIVDLVFSQMSDVAKISETVMRPIFEIARPIPPIPLFGIPIPGVPAMASSIVDFLCDFTLGACIYTQQYDSFAYLKAFHALTNNKYINQDDLRLFKSKEDFDKAKGFIGKNTNLLSLRGASALFAQEIKKTAKPLDEFLKFIDLQVSPLTRPFEQLAKEYRPMPLSLLMPIVGPIYNRVVFVLNLKDMQRRLEAVEACMKNGLKPVKKEIFLEKLTSLTDLEKNPVTRYSMKVLRTLKYPAVTSLEKIDEMFIDPLSKLPWGVQSIATMSLTVVNCIGDGIDGIIREVIETIAGVFTGGIALTVTNILTKFITVKIFNEFITETFYWSYIRYLEKRITRMEGLIKQAQADGIMISENLLEQEVQKILQFKELHQVQTLEPETKVPTLIVPVSLTDETADDDFEYASAL